MEDFIKGTLIGLTAGMVVGGIIVAKNKKLAGKICQGMSKAEDKIQEAKETIEEKMKDKDCIFAGNSDQNCDCNMPGCDCNQDLPEDDSNKKFKK